VLRFWRNCKFIKLSRNFAETFGNFSLLPELFSCPKKLLVEKLHIILLSNIFIFARILKVQFWSKFWKMLRNCWMILSLGPKFLRNFLVKYWQNSRFHNTSLISCSFFCSLFRFDVPRDECVERRERRGNLPQVCPQHSHQNRVWYDTSHPPVNLKIKIIFPFLAVGHKSQWSCQS